MGPPQFSPEAAPLVKSHTKVRVTVLRTFESNLIARLVGHGVHHVTCGAIQRVSAVTVLDGAEHVVFAARGPRMGAH